MKIPSKFEIFGQEITVEMVDDINKGKNYGVYSDAEKKITLAKKVLVDDDWIDLSEDQIMITFYHELVHCFQFYSGIGRDDEMSEIMANTYSGFIYEFVKTRK
jgi:hypothetical protein